MPAVFGAVQKSLEEHGAQMGSSWWKFAPSAAIGAAEWVSFFALGTFLWSMLMTPGGLYREQQRTHEADEEAHRWEVKRLAGALESAIAEKAEAVQGERSRVEAEHEQDLVRVKQEFGRQLNALREERSKLKADRDALAEAKSHGLHGTIEYVEGISTFRSGLMLLIVGLEIVNDGSDSICRHFRVTAVTSEGKRRVGASIRMSVPSFVVTGLPPTHSDLNTFVSSDWLEGTAGDNPIENGGRRRGFITVTVQAPERLEEILAEGTIVRIELTFQDVSGYEYAPIYFEASDTAGASKIGWGSFIRAANV